MKYEIVIHTDAGLDVLRLNEDNVIPALEIRGHKLTGINRNKAQRAELQGQPKFSGLAGPMYNGPGVVRYECPKAYAQLSA